MKGLLIKDYHLLAQQKRYILLITIIGIMLSVTQSEPTFVTGYITFIISLLSISSISYDEFDNGMAFLMTLPSGRKEYVREKYLLSLVNVVISLIVANLIVVICSYFNKNSANWDLKENAIVGLGIAATVLIVISIMIPAVLKYGAEKGRMVIVAIAGVAIIVSYFCSKVATTLLPKPEKLFAFFASVPQVAWGMVAAAIIIIALVLSYYISVRIMEKKEF